MAANRISIQIGDRVFNAEIFDTPTGQAILQGLPWESNTSTWGDEIYFHVSARSTLESDAKSVVEIGDLAYWPTMPAFCIFFGPTPASIGNESRAASAVNVFGRLIDFDIDDLREVEGGEKVRVMLKTVTIKDGRDG